MHPARKFEYQPMTLFSFRKLVPPRICEQGMKEAEGRIGWMTAAAKKAGIPVKTARDIIHGDKVRIGLQLAKKFHAATGCPIHSLYEV